MLIPRDEVTEGIHMPTLRNATPPQHPGAAQAAPVPPGAGAAPLHPFPGSVSADEPGRYVLTLRSAAYAMAPVRRIVRARLSAALPGRPELAESAALLVTELLTNAYLNSGPMAECRLEVRVDGTRVRLVVEDPHPALPTRRRLGLWDEAGRSVRLLDGLAQRWGAEPMEGGGRGKRVWAELDAD